MTSRIQGNHIHTVLVVKKLKSDKNKYKRCRAYFLVYVDAYAAAVLQLLKSSVDKYCTDTGDGLYETE